MTTDMHVRIGSLTKMYTGRWSCSRSRREGLAGRPDLEVRAGNPQRRQGHHQAAGHHAERGGQLLDEPSFTKTLFDHPETVVYTPDQLIAYGVAKSPAFPPGEKFDYSNTNTLLLDRSWRRSPASRSPSCTRTSCSLLSA
jgi:D-alanyl-D-alanine carboxypeptidase